MMQGQNGRLRQPNTNKPQQPHKHMTTEQNTLLEDAIKTATKLGKRHGENSAHWYIQDSWGGRVTRGEKEAASAFLKGLENGDFAITDGFNPPNLSGEYADDMTPQRLMDHCFRFEDDYAECSDFEDDICLSYEDAASEAFWSALQQSAESVLSGE